MVLFYKTIGITCQNHMFCICVSQQIPISLIPFAFLGNKERDG